MPEKDHGNSLNNEADHHLYAIYDSENDDVFKFGISHDPIDKDGLSDRIREQLSLFNLVAGFLRFFAKVLIAKIPGRRKARQLEDEHIEAYRKENGRNPIGNRK